MIRPTVIALALCVVSSAQSMPYVPLQQPNNSVIQVRQGCGLGRQLVDGICVKNSAVLVAVRKCGTKKLRMVNGRCEPRVRPARPQPRCHLRRSNLWLLLPRRVDRRAEALTRTM